ncbi:MAG: FAD binding domain-containing protein [Rectinemataceae bacterium]|jgi:xanthine dehydrogenase small subunit
MTMRFLANDSVIETEAWAMGPALDFIRKKLGLTGTKEGCREGDCGACAVLVGERSSQAFSYRAMPSCLLALGELEGGHLVTIEGLAASGLTPVMRAIAEANGSQCGFCSPGFVISLTAYLLGGGLLSPEGAYTAVEGNLCRCTGYGAIKRAAARLVEEFAGLPEEPLKRLDALVQAGVLPASCAAFARGGLLPIDEAAKGVTTPSAAVGRAKGGLALGGGSDFFVRNPEPEPGSFPAFELLDRDPSLKRVELRGDPDGGSYLEIGAALSWREFFSDPRVLDLVPGIERFEKLLASPLVRERATIGGNIANASPVGDITAMLIALGTLVRVQGAGGARETPLERFFLGYKKIDLRPPEGGAPGEIITTILVPASRPFAHFNFEKVSKRERLDIAAVNSAASFEVEAAGGQIRIARARISAGGVAPVPLFLEKASSFLEGRIVDSGTALEAARIASGEASPIGDVRGSADYRRRILERLVLGHFLRLFPGAGIEEAVS